MNRVNEKVKKRPNSRNVPPGVCACLSPRTGYQERKRGVCNDRQKKADKRTRELGRRAWVRFFFFFFYNKIEFFRSAALVGTAIARKIVDENITCRWQLGMTRKLFCTCCVFISVIANKLNTTMPASLFSFVYLRMQIK